MEGLGYSVRTPVFEGPLELLLDLIEKRKLFVSDVSLAQVTDDFIKHVEQFENFPMREGAEFILVASTLMLIKSRSLLPSLPLTEEESVSISDLEERLRVYQKVRELSYELKKLYGQRVIFEKGVRKSDLVVFSPDKKTDIKNLSEALERVLFTLPKKEVLPKTMVKKIITLEEMIDKLADRVSKNMRTTFKEVYKKEDKINMIVGFLAMLELVKRGVIRVNQEAKHGEIEMETDKIGVPNFS